MADKFSVRIEGDKDLVKKLMALDKAPQKVLEAATLAAAEVIRAPAASSAPGPEIEKETQEKSALECQVDVGPTKDKWHYRFLETGAPPHVIRGNPLLVFEGSDGRIVTRVVNHPGMAARPFLRPAFDEKQGGAADAFGAAILGAIKAVTG